MRWLWQDVRIIWRGGHDEGGWAAAWPLAGGPGGVARAGRARIRPRGHARRHRSVAREHRRWQLATAALGVAFAVCFAVVVVPALAAEPDVPAAFAAGFVNPFAAGYSLDVLAVYGILVALVVRDRRVDGVRGGWVALVLGIVPGVAVGLAWYLLVRARHAAPTPAAS